MSVQMFSDHSDFYKARRALIASAVTLILLQDIELVKNTLTIFSLEFIISLEKISFYVMLVTLYFSYVFLLRSGGQRDRIYSVEHHKTVQDEMDLLTEVRDQLAHYEGEEVPEYLTSIDEHFEYLVKFRSRVLNKQSTEWNTFALVEVIPAWAITGISLSLYFGLHEIGLPRLS